MDKKKCAAIPLNMHVSSIGRHYGAVVPSYTTHVEDLRKYNTGFYTKIFY